MAVPFLTVGVKSPDEADWEKQKRLLRYLNGTKFLKLTISVKDLGVLKWFVDAAHNVHWDCKGHAGAMLTFGEEAVLSYSRKVKLKLGVPLRLNLWVERRTCYRCCGHCILYKAKDTRLIALNCIRITRALSCS